MAGEIAQRFVDAVAARDRAALEAVLAADVDFRGLTPGRSWEAGTGADVVEIFLGSWFEESDHIEEVAGVEVGDEVADVQRVAYRFHVTNDGGPQVVEQQAYYRTSAGRISYLRVLCSGFRPRRPG